MQRTRHRISLFSPLTRSVSLHGAVLLVALAGALALTACASTPTPTVSASTDLARTPWILTRMTVDGAVQPLVADRIPWLQFHPQDGRVWGNSGCNDYGGHYTLAGESLRLIYVAQTMMACGVVAGPLKDSPLMQQDDAYMHALWRVTRLQLAHHTLILWSSDGAVLLTYHPD
jgi:heat shock protein HslJ